MTTFDDRKDSFERKFALTRSCASRRRRGATSSSGCGPPRSSASPAPRPTPTPRASCCRISRRRATTTCMRKVKADLEAGGVAITRRRDPRAWSSSWTKAVGDDPGGAVGGSRPGRPLRQGEANVVGHRARRAPESGAPVITAWCGIPDPWSRRSWRARTSTPSRSTCSTAAIDLAATLRAIPLIAAAGKPAIVAHPGRRVRRPPRSLLDGGASGIIAPMINTVEDARRFGSFVKFPPDGDRSWGPHAALTLSGLAPTDYFGTANAFSLAVAMIETREALGDRRRHPGRADDRRDLRRPLGPVDRAQRRRGADPASAEVDRGPRPRPEAGEGGGQSPSASTRRTRERGAELTRMGLRPRRASAPTRRCCGPARRPPSGRRGGAGEGRAGCPRAGGGARRLLTRRGVTSGTAGRRRGRGTARRGGAPRRRCRGRCRATGATRTGPRRRRARRSDRNRASSGMTSSRSPWTRRIGGFPRTCGARLSGPLPSSSTSMPEKPTTAAGARARRRPTCRAIIVPWLKPTRASFEAGKLVALELPVEKGVEGRGRHGGRRANARADRGR